MGGPRELTFLFFFFKALFLVHFVPCSAAPANAELVGEGGVMSASNNRDLVDEGLCLLLFQGLLWSVRKSPNFLPLSLNLTDFRGPKYIRRYSTRFKQPTLGRQRCTSTIRYPKNLSVVVTATAAAATSGCYAIILTFIQLHWNARNRAGLSNSS